ncbi:MAG: SLBB domain-containing protein [Deltaproteobacteria bacterium]|nr:SLBB domain-containing protein [Deltaproteobacteria bacterium]
MSTIINLQASIPGPKHAGVYLKPPFLMVLAILAVLIFPSCYSSTAVMGIPVKNLSLPDVRKNDTKLLTPAEKETIYQMSQVKENSVFKELSGIPEYRIGPLDVLVVNSHVGDKKSRSELTVNSRGMISYSFIDDMYVVGMTPSQLDLKLTKKLSAYVRRPRIDILIKEFKSKSATIIGELSQLRATTTGKAGSGRINLQGKTSLMDLIALAGGYTIDADIKNVKLIRKGKAYPINVYDILEKGDESQNVIIEDGDVVNVPELPEFGERVYVMGEVNNQGIYPLEDATDLLAAIALAGSFTPLAKEENTLVVRGYERGKPPLVMMSDLKALFRKADVDQNIPLEDGDLVYVPRMVIEDINEWILNTAPLLNLLLYPNEFETRYFNRKYLHIDRPHHK